MTLLVNFCLTIYTKDLLGKQIIGINGISFQTIVDSLSTLISVDNYAMIQTSIPRLFKCIEFLEYFKFVKSDSIYFDVKGNSNDIEDYLITINSLNNWNNRDLVYVERKDIPQCDMYKDSLFYSKFLANENVYYIQYNRCWSKELDEQYNKGRNAKLLPSFNQFKNSVFNDLKNENIKKVVIDLRHNRGGNSLQGTEFIRQLFITPKALRNKAIYLIVGRSTFSSAVLNAMDLKEHKGVLTVGEETAGTPNHFGDVRSFKLPNSKLSVSFSTKYFQRGANKSNSITIDVPLKYSFDNYQNGYDPFLNYIINEK